MKKPSFGLSFSAILFLSCVPKFDLLNESPDAIGKSQEAIINRLSSKVAAPIDKNIIQRSSAHFIYYLRQRFGDKKYNEIVGFLNKNPDKTIEEAALTILNKCIYEIGAECHYRTSYPTGTKIIRTKETPDFRIYYYHPISIRDSSEIFHIVLQSFDIAQSIFFPDENGKMLFKEKLSRLFGNKIEIHLVSDKLNIRNFGLYNSTGNANIRYRIDGEYFRLAMSLNSKYIGLVSTQTFLHEFVHLFTKLYLMDTTTMSISINDICTDTIQCMENQKKLFDKINSHACDMLEEGFAEYISHANSIFDKTGVYADITVVMKHYLKNGFDLPDLDGMSRYYKGERRKSLTYVIFGLRSAHSFVKYLIDNYGMEKFLLVLRSEDFEPNFTRTYAATIGELSRQWKESVKR